MRILLKDLKAVVDYAEDRVGHSTDEVMVDIEPTRDGIGWWVDIADSADCLANGRVIT